MSLFLSGSLGNTNLSLALLDGDRVVAREASPVGSDPELALRSLLATAGEPRAAGYCSVNPPREDAFEKAVRAVAGLRASKVGRDALSGLEIRCREPDEVGADRLASARGALVLGRSDAVVVDAGSAITVDAVTAEGAFLGGAIAPGYRLAARSLHDGTSLLPLVEPGEAANAVGRDTEEAIRAGLFIGIAGLVDALVESALGSLTPGARVLATGGDAPLLARRSRLAREIFPDLVHLGVRAVCAGG